MVCAKCINGDSKLDTHDDSHEFYVDVEWDDSSRFQYQCQLYHSNR